MVKMRSYCAFVALAYLCALQSASGRPDLGINGEIKGSARAVDTASIASMLFELLNSYTFVLGADYPLLGSMADALSLIATSLAENGSIMATNVAALVGDNSGIVAPPFGDAIAGIVDLLALLDARFPPEFLAVQYREKMYITNMLDDNFQYLSDTLTTLNGTLGLLLPAAEQAQASAGGDELPVSLDLIRKHIPVRTVNTLQNTIARLPAAVSPFLYSIDSTLANIDQGDTYILEVKSNIEGFLLQAHQEVVLFNGQLRQLKTDTIDVIENVNASFAEQQEQFDAVLPVLQAASTYQDDLEGAVISFGQTVSAGSVDEKTLLLHETVESYIALATTFDDDLVTLYGDRFCPAVISVVQVLVASGPYAPYCYRKYSPKVLDLAAHHYYDLTECYQLELNRIYSLSRLIGDLIDLVSFNYGELLDDFTVCFDQAPCPGTDCDACVQTLGEILGTLSRLADEKFDLILQIVPTELDASLQRLESCVSFAQYKLIADVHDLIGDVFQCEETGYNST